MARQTPPNQTELDFESDSLEVVEPLDKKAASVAYKMNAIKNPYTGNKRKLIPFLFDFIDKRGYSYDRFLDLFAGSSVVGAAAKSLGAEVYSNDLMLFPYYNAKFLIEGTGQRLTDSEAKSLLVQDGKQGSFIEENYHERFTPEERLALDSYRHRIDVLFPNEDDEKRYVAFAQLLHFVMDSCFVGGRLNKGQVLADLGHRINHPRNGGEAMNFNEIPRYGEFPWDLKGNNKVFNCDAIDLLNSTDCPEADICYIDPPYGGQQSDYSAMYLFFDEFINNGKIEVKENKSRSKFVKSKKYIDHFRELIKSAEKFPVLIFSYNDSSWSNLKTISEEIERVGRRVFVKEVDYGYKYRKQDSESQEYIIAAE